MYPQKFSDVSVSKITSSIIRYIKLKLLKGLNKHKINIILFVMRTRSSCSAKNDLPTSKKMRKISASLGVNVNIPKPISHNN